MLHSLRTTSFIRKITTGIEWYQKHDVISRDWPLVVKPVHAAGRRRAQVRPRRAVDPFDMLHKYIWRDTMKRCTDMWNKSITITCCKNNGRETM